MTKTKCAGKRWAPRYFQVLPGMFLLLCLIFTVRSQAQSFEILKLSSSAKTWALGGDNVSYVQRDPIAFKLNPALINEDHFHAASFSFGSIYSGNQLYSSSYNSLIKSIPVSFGLSYLNYGTFDGYDPVGNKTNDFRSGELALSAGSSHQLGPFRLGLNLNFALSTIENYNASAILFDLGGLYQHPRADFSVGLAVRNLGFKTSDYFDGSQTSLPLDVAVGLTFKPKHMPARFSFTFHQLNEWENNDENEESNLNVKEVSFTEQFFRHLVFGLELPFTKNFSIFMGYDHGRRKTMTTDARKGFTGYSFGLAFAIKRIDFTYALNNYHIAGAAHRLSLVYNFDHIYTKSNN